VRSEPSLIAYWRLDESTGSTANDALGRYNGSYVNGPTLGSAGAIVNDPNKSATFNGTNQRVNLPSLPSVGDFSIEGWTYLTNAAVNNNTLYGGGSTVQLLARPGTGSFPTAAYAGVTLGGTQYVLQPTSPASNINTWVYWVLTRQGGTLTLYRNAVQIAQRTDLPATASANINGYIADELGGLYYLTGGVDDVAVYSSALNPQDITSHYKDAGFGPAPAPTAPPSIAVTNLASGSTYGGNWPGSISGSASSNSGFSLVGVSVAVQDLTTGEWWGGSGFDQPSQTFIPVTSGTGNWSLSLPATNLTSGHSYLVTAQATDSLGNVGASTSVVFSYISDAPTTSIACNGATCSNWYNASVSVALSTTDPGGPGVDATYFTTDGSTPTTSSTRYVGAFTVTSTTAVRFFSVDTAGNAESVKAQPIQIDTVGPTTSISCNGAACSSGSYHGPATGTLPASDNIGGSGAAATFSSNDGVSPT